MIMNRMHYNLILRFLLYILDSALLQAQKRIDTLVKRNNEQEKYIKTCHNEVCELKKIKADLLESIDRKKVEITILQEKNKILSSG